MHLWWKLLGSAGLMFILLLVSGSIFFLPSKPSTLTVDTTTITVELADSPREWTQGLSGRPAIPFDHGMLFIFPTADTHEFWMKDMHFPLDILWIGEDWTIIDITKNVTPASYPETFRPKAPAQYVLEVNAGFVDQYAIGVGDNVTADSRNLLS